MRAHLDAGLAPDEEDAHGNRTINLAAQAGQLDVVRLLVETGARVDEPDGIGRTPLIACAEGNHVELFDFLVACGASIDRAGGEGMTPLMACAVSSSGDVAERLIALGADVNGQRDCGAALHDAVFSACKNFDEPDDNVFIAMLLKAGADINIEDSSGQSPLDLAWQYKDDVDYTRMLMAQSP